MEVFILLTFDHSDHGRVEFKGAFSREDDAQDYWREIENPDLQAEIWRTRLDNPSGVMEEVRAIR